MLKIPTLFVRDTDNMSRVTQELSPECRWVLAGEGVATFKHDGTACCVFGGEFYKRYDYRLKLRNKSKPAPDGWIPCMPEFETIGSEHWPGWAPVLPSDKYHNEAMVDRNIDGFPLYSTLELIGPKVQGNPHEFNRHMLIAHGGHECPDFKPSYDGIRDFLLLNQDAGPQWCMEGIVWHHIDGRRAKIKKRDFGLTWPPKKDSAT